MKQKWVATGLDETKSGDPMVVSNCNQDYDPSQPLWSGEDPRNEGELKEFLKCETFLCSRSLAHKCYECDCTRCWCCFHSSYFCIHRYCTHGRAKTRDDRKSRMVTRCYDRI